MPFFTSDSSTFHYLDAGAGLPFVFQHGLGGDHHQTQDTFASPQFRLLTLDCRGHGETHPASAPDKLTFSQFADDVLAMIDHLNMQQVVIGGISMGSGVALNFALRYPQRVRRLVLVRPAWLCEPLPVNLQIYPRIADLIRRVGTVQGRAQFIQSTEYLEIERTFPVGAASIAKQFERPHAAEYVDVLERIPADAPCLNQGDLAQIRVPTLVLANELDPVHPFQYGEVLAQAIPGATLTSITSKEIDAQQQAREIQQAVDAFLAALTNA
ncbi:MAG: alpha/beta hydrolase [Anaerolineae bacterium]|nr:alpha/beta hydrolase [Anaerolineae bacterium]